MWLVSFVGHVKLHHVENDDNRAAIDTPPRSCVRVMEKVRQKGSQDLFLRCFVNRGPEHGEKIQTNGIGLRPRPKPHGSRATDRRWTSSRSFLDSDIMQRARQNFTQ
jgi:hypothetical protein